MHVRIVLLCLFVTNIVSLNINSLSRYINVFFIPHWSHIRNESSSKRITLMQGKFDTRRDRPRGYTIKYSYMLHIYVSYSLRSVYSHRSCVYVLKIEMTLILSKFTGDLTIRHISYIANMYSHILFSILISILVY